MREIVTRLFEKHTEEDESKLIDYINRKRTVTAVSKTGR